LDIFHYEFMQNALMAGLLASIACGIIGTLVVVNRIVFISGGIAHAAYGGVGLAFFLGLAPLLGVVGFSVAIAIIIALVSLGNKQRADTIIGVLWAVGMALGIMLADLTPGYKVDLMTYLFGSILAVPREDLLLMLFLNVAILGTVVLFYKDFLAMSYDEEFAGLMGVPTRALYIALLIMIALCVVIIIRVVGMILIIAFFTIAPYMAEGQSRSLYSMMLLSILYNCVFALAGLWLSFRFNLTSGATIILVGAAFFFLSLFLRKYAKMLKVGS